MRTVKRSVVAAMVAVACLVSIPAGRGWAQSPNPSEQNPPAEQKPPAGQTSTLSDQKLDQMAAAMKQVASVKDDYEQRIAAAPPSDQQRIAEEAGDALEKAVTDHGLSVEEFNSIIEVAQADSNIREKLRQRLK